MPEFMEKSIKTNVIDGISSKEILEGLTQGSPLICTLFLLFINVLPDVINLENALHVDNLVL